MTLLRPLSESCEERGSEKVFGGSEAVAEPEALAGPEAFPHHGQVGDGAVLAAHPCQG